MNNSTEHATLSKVTIFFVATNILVGLWAMVLSSKVAALAEPMKDFESQALTIASSSPFIAIAPLLLLLALGSLALKRSKPILTAKIQTMALVGLGMTASFSLWAGLTPLIQVGELMQGL